MNIILNIGTAAFSVDCREKQLYSTKSSDSIGETISESQTHAVKMK